MLTSGGQTVKAGTYWDLENGNRVQMDQEGTLPGSEKTRYIKAPAAVMLMAAPIIGLVFAVFLPFIGRELASQYIAGVIILAAAPCTAMVFVWASLAKGDPGDTLYPGWDLATGGVKNKEIHLNACHWLLNPTPDTTAPVITAGPSATAADCSATVTWTTDELSSSVVQYGPTVAYGSTASTAGNVTSHSVALSSLSPGSTYHYRAGSTDG